LYSYNEEADAEFLVDPAITLINVDRFVIAYNSICQKHFIYDVQIQKAEETEHNEIADDDYVIIVSNV
jgi:hypothetical protein